MEVRVTPLKPPGSGISASPDHPQAKNAQRESGDAANLKPHTENRVPFHGNNSEREPHPHRFPGLHPSPEAPPRAAAAHLGCTAPRCSSPTPGSAPRSACHRSWALGPRTRAPAGARTRGCTPTTRSTPPSCRPLRGQGTHGQLCPAARESCPFISLLHNATSNALQSNLRQINDAFSQVLSRGFCAFSGVVHISSPL